MIETFQCLISRKLAVHRCPLLYTAAEDALFVAISATECHVIAMVDEYLACPGKLPDTIMYYGAPIQNEGVGQGSS